MDSSNDESIVIAQIEHIRGVENLEEIIKVDGIDGVFIGPYDLSCSLGVPGQLDHPKVQEAREKVIQVCKKENIALGIHVVPPDKEELEKRKSEGYSFIAYSTDAIVLDKYFRQAML